MTAWLIFALISVGSLKLVTAATGAVTGGYEIDSGQNATISAHAVTKKVTNNHASGLGIYIPLNSATEWATYVSNAPAGVTVEDVASCGGVSVGGYCWYYPGVANQSCDTVCSGHGGCVDSGITWSNDLTNCKAVASAFFGAIGDPWVDGGLNYGCWKSTVGAQAVYFGSGTCSAVYGFAKRFCSCAN